MSGSGPVDPGSKHCENPGEATCHKSEIYDHDQNSSGILTYALLV